MSIKIDVRNLAKWLNEEQTGQIDKQALARVLAHVQMTQQQEPVAWLWELTGEVTTDPDRADGIWLPLYTSPPASKPWVGLTEQERNDLEDYCEMIIGKAAFEAIEAKIKEKNA